MDGMFSGIKAAKISQGGTYLGHGPAGFADGIAKIIACKKGQKRDNVGFFVVELEIIENTNSEQPKGFKCSWFVSMDKDAALGNIKQFASVAGDVDESEVDEAGIEEIVSADNPFGGDLIRFHAFNKPTKKGNPFTRVTWQKYNAPKETPKA